MPEKRMINRDALYSKRKRPDGCVDVVLDTDTYRN